MAGQKRRAHPWRLSDAQRAQIEALIAAGTKRAQVAEAVGCTERTVSRWLVRTGGLRSRVRPRSQLRLGLAERESISVGIARGQSLSQIAREIGRAVSTVSREVAGNGGRARYRAVAADRRASLRARRPKPAKLVANPQLRAAVEAGLRARWSPEQIAARLVVDYPDDASMRVSHETIYQSLFVQSRGALRRELTAQLRTKRTHRRPRARARGGSLREMVPIRERPAEIEDRAVPGHWEGDLLVGKQGHSAIATLVERQTRFVMLVRLEQGRTAGSVRDALAHQITRLPQAMIRSITWDQGKEMAEHARFTVDTGISVYFCDPSSPWQRGTNENTNGLLRQYFPKGTDLTAFTQHDLDHVADELNGRPRQTLGWMKPSEALHGLIAMTA